MQLSSCSWENIKAVLCSFNLFWMVIFCPWGIVLEFPLLPFDSNANNYKKSILYFLSFLSFNLSLLFPFYPSSLLFPSPFLSFILFLSFFPFHSFFSFLSLLGQLVWICWTYSELKDRMYMAESWKKFHDFIAVI